MYFSVYRQFLAILLLLFTSLPSLAAATKTEKIGLVMSGGGARGLAHIGVLKALEEHNIHISAIAGTSMGAVIGALYATGKTPEEIEILAKKVNWGRALDDDTPRENLTYRRKQDSRDYLVKAQATIKDGVFSLPKGIVQGQNLQLLLQRLFVHVNEESSFDDFYIPFRAVATDLETGDAVVLSKGSLATATRASMSIPGFYAPVEIDGDLLVDGGIANNLPIDIVKSMGVDRVIVVDIATPLYNKNELDSVLPIIEQLTTLLTYNQLKKQYELITNRDLLITPDLGDVKNTDFDKVTDAISIGYMSASANDRRLTEFQSREPIGRPGSSSDQKSIYISSITIENESDISDKLLDAHISQESGQIFDREQLEKDLEKIYGYEYFEHLTYQLIPEEAGVKLLITAKEKSWGQDLLGVNFDLFTNSDGESGYNLGLNFRKSAITSRGGESFTAIQFGKEPMIRTELYLPFDHQQISFIRPYLKFSQRSFNHVINKNIVSRFNIENFVFGTALGLEISNLGVFAIGIEEQRGNIESYIGVDSATLHFNDVVRYFLFEYDSLDNLNFPGSGTYIRLKYDRVEPEQRLAENFSLASISLLKSISAGPNSFVFKGEMVRNIHQLSGRHFQQSLGGFMNLSGPHDDALVGSSKAYVGLTYLRRLDQQSLLPVDLPVYAGIAFEAGNVWDRSADMSRHDLIYSGTLLLAIDSPLGPVYLGYGRAEQGYSSYYIKLGRIF